MKSIENRQKYLEQELLAYEEKYPMTGTERRKLRAWVRAGHSVYENPGSRYLCECSLPVQDFLDVYRQDKVLEKELHGKTAAEKKKILMEYMGWDGTEPEEKNPASREQMKGHIRKLERELFQLWGFVGQEGLWDEAREFVQEHADETIPFEWDD